MSGNELLCKWGWIFAHGICNVIELTFGSHIIFPARMYNGCEIISYKVNRSHTQQPNHFSEVEGCLYEVISTILMTPTWCLTNSYSTGKIWDN